MADLHSVTFEWPYGSANNVILTGTFDHWSKSIRLDKQNASFKGTVKVPWNQKVAYKFIVDGEWRVNDREPTEKDPAGNLNNVYVAPEKLVELSKPESTIQREPVLEKVEDIPAEKALSSDGGKVVAPAVLSDLVQTVVAAEGTASAVDYVVSSVGAAIQGVLGVDPINANKLPVQTPSMELPETSVVDTSTTTSHVDVEGQPDESVKDVGIQKSSNLNASIDTTPVLNGTATSTEVSGSNVPTETQSILPLVSGVDYTLASPPKEVATAHGPSTHTPGVITNSSGPAAATDSNVKAETPVVGSPEIVAAPEEKPTIQPATQSPSSVQAVSPSAKAANGDNAHPTNSLLTASTSTPPTSRGTSPSPSTPTKGKHQKFPSSISSSGSPKSDKSSGSSRFRTISHSDSIKKSLKGLRRISFKEIFGLGRDKEKEERGEN